MYAALKAGLAYFALVFGAGFLLGAIRTTALAPRLGDVAAVALELPAMLYISWIACKKITGVFSVAKNAAARLGMGGVAFAVLLLAETGMSVWGFGWTIGQHFETYRTTASQLGFAAQCIFALFPAIQAGLRHGPTSANGRPRTT
jgi:hypothetical protein